MSKLFYLALCRITRFNFIYISTSYVYLSKVAGMQYMSFVDV